MPRRYSTAHFGRNRELNLPTCVPSVLDCFTGKTLSHADLLSNMLLSIQKFTSLKCQWNSRPLTEDDFFKLCRKHKVTVLEMPLQVGGFYYCVLGRHYIAIDSRLSPWKKLFVMFHEFGHFLMHAPDRGVTANFHGIGGRTRKEIEADAFATCALLPRPLIESRSFQELVEEDGYTEDLVLDRLLLYQTFGV